MQALLRLAGASLCAALLIPAQAAVVSFHVQGTLTSVTPQTSQYPFVDTSSPFDALSVGGTLNATVSYDTDKYGFFDSSNTPAYLGQLGIEGVGVGAARATFDQGLGLAQFVVPFSNRYLPAKGFSVSLFFDPNTFTGGTGGNPPPIFGIDHFLRGALGGIYQGSALVTPARFRADVTQLTQTPLPAAAWLFASALAGLAGLRLRARGRSSAS